MSECAKMFNYDFARVICKDGEVVEGKTISLNYADETENGEDLICLETKSGMIGISENEIERWEIPMAFYKEKRR